MNVEFLWRVFAGIEARKRVIKYMWEGDFFGREKKKQKDKAAV